MWNIWIKEILILINFNFIMKLISIIFRLIYLVYYILRQKSYSMLSIVDSFIPTIFFCLPIRYFTQSINLATISSYQLFYHDFYQAINWWTDSPFFKLIDPILQPDVKNMCRFAECSHLCLPSDNKNVFKCFLSSKLLFKERLYLRNYWSEKWTGKV